jgi:ABC-type transport system involved in cytochrome bd biosynthesis fused ATPase/permease subunit
MVVGVVDVVVAVVVVVVVELVVEVVIVIVDVVEVVEVVVVIVVLVVVVSCGGRREPKSIEKRRNDARNTHPRKTTAFRASDAIKKILDEKDLSYFSHEVVQD